jgi:hypothetical protein
MATPNIPARPIPLAQLAPLQQAKMLTPEEAAEYEAGGGTYTNPLDPDENRFINVTNASSHVAGFSYDAKKRQLLLVFQPNPKTGFVAKCIHSNVPLETYLELKEAVSFGSQIYHQIGNKFKTRYPIIWRNYTLKS